MSHAAAGGLAGQSSFNPQMLIQSANNGHFGTGLTVEGHSDYSA
jgi:hypothetical protein